MLSGLHGRVTQEIDTDCGKNLDCFQVKALTKNTAVDVLSMAFGVNVSIGVKPEARVSQGGHSALDQTQPFSEVVIPTHAPPACLCLPYSV